MDDCQDVALAYLDTGYHTEFWKVLIRPYLTIEARSQMSQTSKFYYELYKDMTNDVIKDLYFTHGKRVEDLIEVMEKCNITSIPRSMKIYGKRTKDIYLRWHIYVFCASGTQTLDVIYEYGYDGWSDKRWSIRLIYDKYIIEAKCKTDFPIEFLCMNKEHAMDVAVSTFKPDDEECRILSKQKRRRLRVNRADKGIWYDVIVSNKTMKRGD
jgi:hypothetical protein